MTYRIGGLSRRVPPTTLIAASGGVCLEYAPNFVPDPSKDSEFFFLGPGRVRGIVKTPVMAIHLAREHGADLVRIAADSNDGLNRLIEEFAQVLRADRIGNPVSEPCTGPARQG